MTNYAKTDKNKIEFLEKKDIWNNILHNFLKL